MTLYCLEKAPKTHAVRNIGELLIKEEEVVLWMLGLSDSPITVATLITNQQQHAIFFNFFLRQSKTLCQKVHLCFHFH